jgi:hypothetical protein
MEKSRQSHHPKESKCTANKTIQKDTHIQSRLEFNDKYQGERSFKEIGRMSYDSVQPVRKQKTEISNASLAIRNIAIRIFRLSRQQYGQITYDSRACYDRILPNIAAMASRKYGIPETLANLYYKTLTNTKYRVKIIGGTKRYVYSNNKKTPIYDTGQGSRNSPIIWLFVSDIIAQIMEENAIRATYLGEEKNILLKSK